MGCGNPNWIRAAKERRALALRNAESKPERTVGGFILAALLGAAIAMVIIGVIRSRRGGQ
jgi:hypothetical protein